MKRMIICFVAVLSAMWSVFGVTVTNVRGEQRPGSKLVDIYYDLNSTDGGTYTVEVVLEGDTETVQAVSLTGDIGKGVKSGKDHHVVWDAGVDWVSKKGYVKAVVTATSESSSGNESSSGKIKKVQLWEGGPYWADRNIGADEPWEYGLYFWWGDTVGYKRVNNAWVASDGSSSNFQFYYDPISEQTHGKSPSVLYSEGWTTASDVLTKRHDAAHVKFGGSWRMPTYRELSSLTVNCDWTRTAMNGVNGYVVRGRGAYASNSIFLPFAGYGVGTSLCDAGSHGHYWSSATTTSAGYYGSWSLDFGSDVQLRSHGRDDGFSVRPVQGFTK